MNRNSRQNIDQVQVSKFLSYVLRHRPEKIGLQLDSDGWANIDELIAAAAKNGKSMDRELIQQIVTNNDKQRFGLSDDGQRIRAVQGHSTNQVQLKYTPIQPPAILYHGTATRFLQSIRANGLKPGTRHHVHLSGNVQTAVKVGQRHGQPAVLKIDTQGMHRKGLQFYQADNGVWLTDHVPPEFISGP